MRDRVSVWLRRANPVWFVAAVLLASLAVALPQALLALVVPSLEISAPAGMSSLGWVGQLVVGSLVVPFVETAVFQAAPIGLLRRNTPLRYPAILCISAALFAASHFYSWAYVVFAFPVGIVLAIAYASRRRQGGNPFILVTVVHGLRNALASVASYAAVN